MSANWISTVWKQLLNDQTPLVLGGKRTTVGDSVKGFRQRMIERVAVDYADSLGDAAPAMLERQDDQLAYFAQHAAIQTLSGIEKYEYAPAKFANGDLIPIVSELDEGTDVYAWWEQMVLSEGAKLISNDADDVPLVELAGEMKTGNVYTLASGFYYTRQDLRKSAKARAQMVNDKSAACRETMDRKLNELIVNGEAGTSLKGLKDIGISITAATGNWNSGGTATGAQVLSVFQAGLQAITSASGGVETPDTIVTPPLTKQYLDFTLFNSAVSDKSIFKHLKEVLSEYGVTRWETAIEMETAGADGGGAIFMYKNDRSRIKAEVPIPPTAMPLQQRGRRYITEMEGRYGGVVCKRPRSFLRIDGIEPEPT